MVSLNKLVRLNKICDIEKNRLILNMLIFIGATPRINAAFGQGGGPVLLDDVRCTGLEYRLLDCVNTGSLEIVNCPHSKDAGVICTEGKRQF